jgi:serpin B
MKRKTPLLVWILLFTVLASCKKSGVVPGKGKDLVLTPAELQKVAADNAVTLKLFKNLDSANTGTTNLFISPLSVSFAFGMTSNGANGQTLTAIRNTMDFNGFTQDLINNYYDNLITNLPQLDPLTTINIANSIWYRQDFSVLPAFLQTNSTYYHAKIQSLDFTSSSAPATINSWVNQQTGGKIPAIVNQIPSDAVMYLINAIYFKSGWREKFDPAKTAKLDFYLPDNSTVQANFMDGKVGFNHYDNTEAHIFELPYSNSKYSMVIVMPATGQAVNQLAAGLDSAKWNSWMNNLEGGSAELKLPKFTFSYSVDLNNTLSSLGMGIAFSDNADFTGINATERLKITDVVHKAFVAVDESGTTAAAATSVEIGPTAAAPQPPVVIDHPFIFAIREMKSGLILFVGTVNNPLLTGN